MLLLTRCCLLVADVVVGGCSSLLFAVSCVLLSAGGYCVLAFVVVIDDSRCRLEVFCVGCLAFGVAGCWSCVLWNVAVVYRLLSCVAVGCFVIVRWG